MNFILTSHAIIRATERFGREYARTAKPREPVPDWLRRMATKAYRKKNQGDPRDGAVSKRLGRMEFLFKYNEAEDVTVLVTVNIHGPKPEPMKDYPSINLSEFRTYAPAYQGKITGDSVRTIFKGKKHVEEK